MRGVYDRTPEHRASVSERLRRANAGKPKSAEHRAKIGAGVRAAAQKRKEQSGT